MTQADVSPGLSLELAADIHASLGALKSEVAGMRAELKAERARNAALAEKVIPLRIPLLPVTLTGSAPNLTGILDLPQVLGPSSGWVWQIDGTGAQGFTTGSVAVYLMSTSDAEIYPLTSAGVFYQRKSRFLGAGERLVYQATGITGTVSVWVTGMAATQDVAHLLYT